MFTRRSTKTATDEAAAAQVEADNLAAGKGRATPSRKEAEAARKARVSTTATSSGRTGRGASKADRDAARADRARKRAALYAGDDRYLPARDQGKPRKYARDLVDAKRTPSEFMLPSVLVFLVLSFLPLPAGVKLVLILGFYVYMLLLVGSVILLARRVGRLVATRYPDELTKGVGVYGAMRSMQIRRMRIPRPQVSVGDSLS